MSSPPTPRAQWREAFIRRQLAALKELGLSPQTLAREEALLRGGFAATSLIRPDALAP